MVFGGKHTRMRLLWTHSVIHGTLASAATTGSSQISTLVNTVGVGSEFLQISSVVNINAQRNQLKKCTRTLKIPPEKNALVTLNSKLNSMTSLAISNGCFLKTITVVCFPATQK